MILQTPINQMGYGYSGYNLAKQLAKLTDLTIYPIGQPDPELYEHLQEYDWRNIDPGCSNRHNVVKLWHQNGLYESVAADHNYVGFPIFELDTFTNEEIRSMNHCDELFVCSEWARQVTKRYIKKEVHVVPLGVDRSIFNEHGNSSRRQTIFFNCGKWEIRKGHDVLLECFNRAFGPSDDVEFWMIPHNPFIGQKNDEWASQYRSSKLGSKIRIIPRQNTQHDVYNIMRQADCGVFPVRAEGWNLELLEMMSCGKHVITTDYSGHTEFVSPQNARLVNITSFQPAQDGIWFFGQGNWASFTEDNKEQLISHMRDIHQLKKDGELYLNQAGVDTSRKFTWENTAKTMCDILGE